ncbi:hypothetical protein EMIHUDRAFT_455702 [Emiliania huxleyi CCMP1516]|uniref:Uncharacterized protein n=2 Tax=Emiliania huxleyi TaxID=2903 RepID=A0A0D3KDB0_EMIH1|nr:hypothetical protein EMIHUDRAFT_455702 [Emiliania huxleyi CCMP1516]EOD33745.1 hypothetical protein EMIHUDRAFT_455702 [Emiliania huxleyi CCMP1516]|eukprot:XP_005786174.1 hypothetical protein EMIHUDRAFT_455702 [Emiliania huxleyi CCMP1516]
MTWTKGHHYLHRAGGLGWVAPSAASIAVHYLKQHDGPSGPNGSRYGEWLHTHAASSASARPAFPPLLWRFEQPPLAAQQDRGDDLDLSAADAGELRVPPPRLTAMQPEVHAWYIRTCGERSSVALMRAADRALQPSAGPRGSRGAVDYYGGNPVAWPGYGCHPSRFSADPAAAWQAVGRAAGANGSSAAVLGERWGQRRAEPSAPSAARKQAPPARARTAALLAMRAPRGGARRLQGTQLPGGAIAAARTAAAAVAVQSSATQRADSVAAREERALRALRRLREEGPRVVGWEEVAAWERAFG